MSHGNGMFSGVNFDRKDSTRCGALSRDLKPVLGVEHAHICVYRVMLYGVLAWHCSLKYIGLGKNLTFWRPCWGRS